MQRIQNNPAENKTKEKGLTKKEIDELPTFKFEKKEGDDQLQCSICYNEFE
jgi:hypothetical protein